MTKMNRTAGSASKEDGKNQNNAGKMARLTIDPKKSVDKLSANSTIFVLPPSVLNSKRGDVKLSHSPMCMCPTCEALRPNQKPPTVLIDEAGC